MKIIKISVSFNQTVQLRQFEPVNFFGAAEAELESNEFNSVSYEILFKMVKEQVMNQIEEVKAGRIKPPVQVGVQDKVQDGDLPF